MLLRDPSPTPHVQLPCRLHSQAHATLTLARTVGRAPLTPLAGTCALAHLVSEESPARPTRHVSTAVFDHSVHAAFIGYIEAMEKFVSDVCIEI